MADAVVAGLVWLLVIVGVGYVAGVDLYVNDAWAEEFIRFEVCSYTKDGKGFAKPTSDYAKDRELLINPAQVVAITQEAPKNGVYCSRITVVGGVRILIFGRADEIEAKLEEGK